MGTRGSTGRGGRGVGRLKIAQLVRGCKSGQRLRKKIRGRFLSKNKNKVVVMPI